MAHEFEGVNPNQEGWLGSCLLWFFWGISLSFMTILSLALMVMLAASVALNVYLGWQLAGLEVAVSRRAPQPIEAVMPVPPNVLAAIPTNTPEPVPTSTPSLRPIPTEALLESQVATIAAIATQVAAAQLLNPPAATPAALPPTVLPPAIAIDTPAANPNLAQPAPAESALPGSISVAAPTATAASSPVAAASLAQEFAPPNSSSNQYALIPINGQRESRPAAEHGDLNLKLREPVASNVETSLVEIPGSGIDPNAPKFSSVFSPDDLIDAYAIHDWDWGSNSVGNLLPENEAVLIAVKTTPGQPLFIPKTERDIYDGKYFATLLYASEDSLTFVYAREGTVAKGYTVHYVGLNTDPNLLKLFEESKGNELPGLSLDTPVGWASDKLLVAIRDNGKFLDARSKKDWWE